MRRSANVPLLLLGGLGISLVAGCGPGGRTRITPRSVYPNDHYIKGVGYYHAAYHAFFPRRFNDYDPATHQYFAGGQWLTRPDVNVVNLSAPSPEAAAVAQRALELEWGGFGSTGTSRSHFS